MPIYETVEIKRRSDTNPQGDLVTVLNQYGIVTQEGGYRCTDGSVIHHETVITHPLSHLTSPASYLFTARMGRWQVAGVEVILAQTGPRRKAVQVDRLTFQLRICVGAVTVELGSAQVRDGFACQLDSKQRRAVRLTAQLVQPLLAIGMGDSLGLEMVQEFEATPLREALTWNGCLTVYLRRIS